MTLPDTNHPLGLTEDSPEWGLRTPGTRLFELIAADGTERWLTMYPGYDFTSPLPNKNFGVHGAEMEFGLKRGQVAVTWTLLTGWQWPEVIKRWRSSHQSKEEPYEGLGSICYHVPVPLYEGHLPDGPCKRIGTCCYSGATFTGSGDLFAKMVKDPAEVWKDLLCRLESLEKNIADERAAGRNWS